MDQPAVVSFSAPHHDPGRTEVLASPVLELAYAFFFLAQHPDSESRRSELPWVDDIYRDAPELPSAISGFWPEPAKHAGLDLFWMSCELGYARDQDPARFLADLPGLPERFLKRLEPPQPDADAHEREMLEHLERRLIALKDGERLERYRALLAQLWAQLEPRWLAEGGLAVEAAREALLKRLEETGDVMAALPPHHFTQFEASAEEIRKARAAGALLVIPLSVAAGGGFNFDVQGFHYLGYGLQSESLFERLKAETEGSANRLKALADPTRLLLLTLIARYEHLAITVSDLAKHLGVSQPTVSGHLKVLREAGLVTADKAGAKTFYRLEREPTKAMLNELSALLKLI